MYISAPSAITPQWFPFYKKRNITEVVWLRNLLSDLFDLELEATCTFCDNQSFVKFSKNPVFHDKSKHI